MLTLQQISDQLEIQNTLVKYSVAVDRQEWDVLDEVFTEDADLDFTDIADWRGTPAEFKEWLQMLPPVRTYYHMTSNLEISIDGDTATTRCVCFNPMSRTEHGFMIFGHWYRDQWIRTSGGWRIRHRYEETCYTHALPDMPEVDGGGR